MLADARHEGPVPPEVAARLDEVLTGLHADPSPAPGTDVPAEPERPATVVPLRRRAARYLLAAAAVVAIGYGTTQVVGGSMGSSGDDSGASSDAGGDTTAGRGTDSGSAAEDAPPPTALAPLEELGVTGLEPLEPVSLDEDLYALGSTAEKEATARRGAVRFSDVCGPRTPVPGSRTLAAAYDGRPTLVVYLPVEGDSQRVDLYLCDAEQPRQAFRSVTLPAGE